MAEVAVAPRLSTGRKLLFSCILLLFAYAAAESVTSILYVRGGIWPDPDVFLYEESSRTVAFDPVRGYRLSPEPTRFARVTRGELCFDGVLRGNNQGFADRDDFSPGRSDGVTRRIAVFGDSFTAAQYLEKAWPDRVEDLAAAAGGRVELLNFSLEGAGLMNWLSTIERYVIPAGYQLDGVVFAVFENDLERGFHVRDDSNPPVDGAGQRGHSVGFVRSWDPDALPRSLAEARTHFESTRAFVVTHDEYERGLRGEWTPVDNRPFRPFLLWRTVNKLGIPWGNDERLTRLRESRAAYANDVEGRRRAYERLAVALRKLGVPVLVIRMPSRPELLGEAPAGCEDKRDFAAAIGATFVDGAEFFKGLDPEGIRDHFLRYDLHWNQKGSDRFARLFWEQRLAGWP